MRYTVAVRTLCDFTAKAGDLDLRFTPSPTAQEGIAGHAAVAARRGPGYEAELRLEGSHRHLLVRGRADGFDSAAGRVDEVKTFRGDLQAMPANHRALHWAQLKLYGALVCRSRGLPSVQLALVYYDIGSQQETVLTQTHGAAALDAFFAQHCERFLDWADQELAHRAARDVALRALPFVHPDFRRGQRPLAEAVYRAAVAGRCLMAQAPTGTGKTIGSLFPLLKAMPGQRLDRLFYLTAKGSGRALALQALRTLGRIGPADGTGARLPLRVVELVARDKACEHPDKACHGAACPLAAGFYDRLPAARQAALDAGAAHGPLDQPLLRRLALAHAVCPYYLGQELAHWSDVVVGDFNHYFDAAALLHALTVANEWAVGVLVDEAHNLVGRARAMYSASLRQADLPAVRSAAPVALRRVIDRFAASWQALVDAQPPSTAWADTADGATGAAYAVLPGVPRPLLGALQQAVVACTEHLAEQPHGARTALLDWYFGALQFSRLADSFGDHSMVDMSMPAPPATGWLGAEPDAELTVRNVVPAPFLAPRWAAARTAVLLSATLAPEHFHADMLGLPDSTARIDVASPFDPAQLAVHIVPHISTRYARRGASVAPIAALMARQYAAAPGNYLAFFSSFVYLQQAADVFRASHPHVPVWQQSPQMPPADRAAFLERFQPDGQGIGFAVLGGAFGEGIDLPGTRLVGAFIATLGLPQRNPVNEQMKMRMETLFGAGHDYAYLFPGVQKVVQAAGRVIRTPTDRGVVYLIDDRFMQPHVRRLLPAWWSVQVLAESPPVPAPQACA